MNKKHISCLIYFFFTSTTYCQEIINDPSLTLTNNQLFGNNLIGDPFLLEMIDDCLNEQTQIESSTYNREVSIVEELPEEKLPELKHSKKYHCKTCNVFITSKSDHVKTARHASVVRFGKKILPHCPICQKTLLPGKRTLYFHMHRFHKK